MEQELVSVIIPTYKRNDTLKRAIESALRQTYKNIEIIVVDDNANFPDIREKNRELVAHYSNIRFFENETNLGGGLTRNVGISKALGDYLAFLDDDDEFLPEKIEKQYELYKTLKNDNVAMIYCYANMINTDGTTEVLMKNYEGTPLYENVCSCIAATSWWFCPKEKLLSVGGFEDISSRQDASLLVKLLARGYEIYRVPEVLLNYYWHDAASGISKNDHKTVEAEKKYRDIFLQVSKGLSEDLKNRVLAIFSFRIAMQYILIGDRKAALLEYKNMLMYRPSRKMKVRTLFGIVFNNAYRGISKVKNRRRS
ncbi:TPA: glycosyltransferase family 2 protein [Streptococcus suis]